MERMRASGRWTAPPFRVRAATSPSRVYARVDNRQFRLLKAATPGSYTFILRARRGVPKRLQHPSRKTIGLRIADHRVVRALLAELGEPLLTSTLLLPGDDVPLNDANEIRSRLEHAVDLVLDSGSCGITPTTVVDLTGEAAVIMRLGKGSLAPLGAKCRGRSRSEVGEERHERRRCCLDPTLTPYRAR